MLKRQELRETDFHDRVVASYHGNDDESELKEIWRRESSNVHDGHDLNSQTKMRMKMMEVRRVRRGLRRGEKRVSFQFSFSDCLTA